jgi:hypothetical protein
MKIDPKYFGMSLAPTSFSTSNFSPYCLNFYSSVKANSYQISNTPNITLTPGSGSSTALHSSVTIAPLWDYFFYSYLGQGKNANLWDEDYLANPTFYNNLFGGFFREFMRYMVDNDLANSTMTLGSADDPSTTAWLKFWKSYLDTAGIESATPNTRGPYGSEKMVPGELNYGWKSLPVRSNHMLWAIQTVRMLMESVQKYLEIYNKEITQVKNQVQSCLKLSQDMSTLHNEVIQALQSAYSGNSSALQELTNQAQIRNEKRSALINTQKNALQKQQQSLSSGSQSIADASSTINNLHDIVRDAYLEAFDSTTN